MTFALFATSFLLLSAGLIVDDELNPALAILWLYIGYQLLLEVHRGYLQRKPDR